MSRIVTDSFVTRMAGGVDIGRRGAFDPVARQMPCRLAIVISR